jgi:hypothetical protein
MKRLYLVPPRNPLSNKNADCRWTLIVPRPYGVDHIDLYGTNINLPEEAKEKANCHLGQDYAWEPTTGLGYKAEEAIAES